MGRDSRAVLMACFQRLKADCDPLLTATAVPAAHAAEARPPRLPFDSITYANIDEARLQGLEVEAAYDPGWGFFGLGGTLNEGENKETGDPLNSVYPDRLTATAGFRALSDRLSTCFEMPHPSITPT